MGRERLRVFRLRIGGVGPFMGLLGWGLSLLSPTLSECGEGFGLQLFFDQREDDSFFFIKMLAGALDGSEQQELALL